MKISVNANPRASRRNNKSRQYSFGNGQYVLPTVNWTLLTFSFFVLLYTSCHNPVDQKKVIGTWTIRKDSSEMRLVFTTDSLVISYLPEKSRFAYGYYWKQDEEEGLLECTQEVPLHSDTRERKVLRSPFYVLKVSSDSISVWVPAQKRRYDLKKADKK